SSPRHARACGRAPARRRADAGAAGAGAPPARPARRGRRPSRARSSGRRVGATWLPPRFQVGSAGAAPPRQIARKARPEDLHGVYAVPAGARPHSPGAPRCAPRLPRALGDVLPSHGSEPSSAADGEAGLREGLHGGADLVVLDLMLPRRNGFGVWSAVRAARPRPPIPLLTPA